MAWRIDEYLIRGEIDNRIRGRVTGRLWILGREEPVVLDLDGDAWRDVAGHVLRFTHTTPAMPEAGTLDGLAAVQVGVVGDITASRKVKVPDCSIEEMMHLIRAGEKFPWHWSNSLYLEWHSEKNGRVVIESASCEISIDPEAAWTMCEAEETLQREANGRATAAFMERLSASVSAPVESSDADSHAMDEIDDDAPTSAAEASADAEQARMDLLLDRVQARIERARDAGEEPDHETIFAQERERLRRERGEPEPEPPTPEEEAERAACSEEMNAAAEEALAASASDEWKDREHREHPLVARCHELHLHVHREIAARGWLTDADPHEHPLRELEIGVMIAGGKLAGVLHARDDEDDWPPEPLFAGSTLVRLKKARGHLRDSLAGADAAAEQSLADAAWLAQVRADLIGLLTEVEIFIAEVRAVLEGGDKD